MTTMPVNHSTRSTTNWAAGIEGCLLVGIGAMLLRKTWDDQLALYIHPRYTPLILATGVLLLLIGGVRLWQTSDQPQGLRGRIGMYGLLLAPLLLGVLIPAKPAGSALVDPALLQDSGSGYRTQNVLAGDDTSEWTLFEWMWARYTLKPEQIAGKPVDVIGFVYRDPNQAADQFHVVRYTLACCIADRSSVSLPVQLAGAASLPNDQWVHVTGTIQAEAANGPLELLVTDARVEPVSQPKEPYLYP